MDFVSRILDLLLTLPAILLAMSVHELCHGYAAYRLGDPTAKWMGRLSLNPFRHIDPFGFIMLLVFRFGWAKPVSVDPRFLKKPKRDMAIISLAGPVSNFIFAFFSAFLYMLVFRLGIEFAWISSSVFFSALTVIEYMVYVNLGLGVFNLIPIPPLDGSKILYAFLPYGVVYKIQAYERYISFALFLLLFLGVLSVPITTAVGFLFETIMGLAQGVIF